jgi:hypothetical protein
MKQLAKVSLAPLGLALCATVAATATARAEWQVDNGVAIVAPTANNSTMELLAISCGDPYQVEVYSRGGPVRPDPDTGANGGGAAAETDYFYKPGKVEARVDGKRFALAAAGSEAAVVLFMQGKAAQSYLAPVTAAFIDALKDGASLTLAFDVTDAANAQDGTAYETTAEFPLAGSREALEEALASCR